MYTVDTLIERLEEQIELAPRLEENQVPGGRSLDDGTGIDYSTLSCRLKEGMAHASSIEALKTVEGGQRRYVKHLTAALVHVEELVPIFRKVRTVRGASYVDGAQRDAALSRLSPKDAKGGDLSNQIVFRCKGAIAELEKGRKVLEEGEAKETKMAGAAAK